MLDFLKTFFRPQRSGATAKERLRLVLLSDHLSLAPELVDALKAELYDVFERYFEYDSTQTEVTFEHREHEFAMLASVPIRRVRERPARPLRVVESPSRKGARAPVQEELVAPQAAPPTPRPRKRRRRRSGAGAKGGAAAAPAAAPTSQPAQA